MAGPPPLFAFLSDDDESRLLPLISNYLALGQFELARAAVRQLHATDAARALAVLGAVADGGAPAAWLGSRSVPSPAHMAWLCALEHDRLAPASPTPARRDAELDLLLTLSCPSDDPRLSAGAAGGLGADVVRAAALGPSREPAYVLCQRLAADPAAKRTAQALRRAWIDAAAEVLDTAGAAAAVEQLKYVPLAQGEEDPEAEAALQALLARLVAASDPAVPARCSVARASVYEALVAIPSSLPLQCMCKEEEQYARSCAAKAEQKGPLPLPYALLQREDVEDRVELFWRAYAHYCKSLGVHVMEHALHRALDLVRARDLRSAALCVDPVPRLRPMLALLAWDAFPTDTRFHSDLLDLLWAPRDVESDEDLLARACRRLAYQVETAKWAAAHSAGGDGEDGKWAEADRVMQQLGAQHSLPYILADRLDADEAMKSADVSMIAAYRVVTTIAKALTEKKELVPLLPQITPELERVASPESRAVVVYAVLASMFASPDLTATSATDLLRAVTSLRQSTLTGPVAARLDRLLDDTRFRLRASTALIDRAHRDGTEPLVPTLSLIGLVLADPSSLLALALRLGDYATAHEIAKYFSISGALASQLERDELLDSLARDGAQATALPDQPASVLCDLAVRAPARAVTRAAIDKARVAQGSCTYADALDVALCSARSASVPAAVVLSSPHSERCSGATQRASVEARDELLELRDAAKSLVTDGGDEDADVAAQVEAINERLATLAKESLQSCYLHAFVSHVRSLCGALASDEDALTRKKLLEMIQTRPAEIINDLVFRKHKYELAERIGAILKLDVREVVTEALAGRPDEPHTSLPLPHTTDMDVVRYVGLSTPALASAVCLLLPCGASLLQASLDYAVEHTSGPLRRWAERQRALVSLVTAASAKSEDAVLHGLASADPAQAERACASVVEAMAAAGGSALEDAIRVADERLERGAPDALLLRAAALSRDRAGAWRLLARVGDKSRAAPLILEWMSLWDLDTCRDMLYMCLCELGPEDKSLPLVTAAIKRLEVFGEITAVNCAKWKDWRQVEALCKHDAKSVVSDLLQSQNYVLARKLREVLDDLAISNDVEEACLTHMLVVGDRSAAMTMLCDLGDACAHGVARRVLSRIAGAPFASLADRCRAELFLAEHLVTLGRGDDVAALAARAKGLRALLALPEALHEQCAPIVDTPSAIAENLIVTTRITELGALVREIPDIISEEVIIEYAGKALEFPGEDADCVEETAGFVLTGRAEEDGRARAAFRFAHTPNVNLAKSLLGVCPDPVAAGEACVALCTRVGESVLESLPYAEEKLDVVGHLLCYARTLFDKAAAGQQQQQQQQGGSAARQEARARGAALCDHLLGAAQLYASLLGARCTLGMSMADLLSADSARRLRDALVASDRLRMAVDVAVRCNISPASAWARWGLSLLRHGRLPEAREKFRYCFAAPKRVAVDEAVDAEELLSHIVETLEARGELDECVHYVRAYGTPRDHVALLVRRGLLEEACRQALADNVPDTQFVEEIMLHCIARNELGAFKAALRAADPALQRSRGYLTFACKYLSRHRAWELLLDVQTFMADYTRAGLTSLHMFLETDPLDFARRVQLLECARGHFEEALAGSSGGSGVGGGGAAVAGVAAGGDLAQKMMTADMQVQLIRMVQRNPRAAPPELLRMTLFGPTREKAAIAEHVVLMGNYDLAYQFVQHFRLPGARVYGAAVKAMLRAKQGGRVQDVLRFLKPLLPDSDWDAVVLVLVVVTARDLKDPKGAEKHLPRLVSSRARVRAQIACGKLKAAFMSAAEEGMAQEIELILREAEGNDAHKVTAALCRRYLDEHKSSAAAAPPQSASDSSSIGSVPSVPPSPSPASPVLGISPMLGVSPLSPRADLVAAPLDPSASSYAPVPTQMPMPVAMPPPTPTPAAIQQPRPLHTVVQPPAIVAASPHRQAPVPMPVPVPATPGRAHGGPVARADSADLGLSFQYSLPRQPASASVSASLPFAPSSPAGFGWGSMTSSSSSMMMPPPPMSPRSPPPPVQRVTVSRPVEQHPPPQQQPQQQQQQHRRQASVQMPSASFEDLAMMQMMQAGSRRSGHLSQQPQQAQQQPRQDEQGSFRVYSRDAAGVERPMSPSYRSSSPATGLYDRR
eukprot:m51a1_g8945 hypothetical protein (2135) ;mRNA; r:985425-992656